MAHFGPNESDLEYSLRVTKKNTKLEKHLQASQDEVTALKEENARLRTALEHYVQGYIFDEPDDDTEQLDLSKHWRHYSGKRARAALKQDKGEQ